VSIAKVWSMALPIVLVGALWGACKEEPPIVIKFEPADMAGVKSATVAAPMADGATAATPADLGAAKTPDLGAAKKAGGEGKAECKVAADCVVLPVECCDCANGGKQMAVPKTKVASIKAERQKHCKDALCTQVFSSDPTCGQEAACQAGQCVMTEKAPGTKKAPGAKPAPGAKEPAGKK
jgi:hypothetical protein